MTKDELWNEMMEGGKYASPLQVRITPQMKAKVKVVADKQHLSMTGLIEKLLVEEIFRNESTNNNNTNEHTR